MSTFNFRVNAQQLSAEITNLLDEESINTIAKEVGFTRRASEKISGFKFLDILLFTHLNHKELSLNDLTIQIYKRYGVKISKQSIDERFTEGAVGFFKAILEKAINISIKQDCEIDFTEFKTIRIKDSTSFQLPENMKDEYPGSSGKASPAAVRIQFEYDLKNEKILDLNIYPFTTQDMTNARETLQDIDSNDLIIRDLGYIKIKFLQEIENKKAYYLNRLHSNSKAYQLIDHKFIEIDFWKVYKYLKINKLALIEKEVYLGTEKFKTRMIIECLPDAVYQERLRKEKKKAAKNKQQISKARKAKMGLNIFITNTKIPAKQIRLLYTLRWQIELMFKIWKSIGEIDKIKKMKVERFETYLFAKLIWIAINWHIMRQIVIHFFNESGIEISPFKLFKTLKISIMDFRKDLKNGFDSVLSFINEIAEISPEKHKSEKKKGAITWSYDIIRMFKTA